MGTSKTSDYIKRPPIQVRLTPPNPAIKLPVVDWRLARSLNPNRQCVYHIHYKKVRGADTEVERRLLG